MPIGSTICMSGSVEPRPIESSESSISVTKKPRYLKVHSRARSNVTAAIRARLRVSCDGECAITCEANVFTSVEPTSSSTQRQSIQP